MVEDSQPQKVTQAQSNSTSYDCRSLLRKKIELKWTNLTSEQMN